jgi:hypothetical protein
MRCPSPAIAARYQGNRALRSMSFLRSTSDRDQANDSLIAE